MVEVLRAKALEGVPHGFLTRRGGVSVGAIAGLNAGFGAQDDPASVAENRHRAVEAVLPGATLATPYQVHSADAVIVQNSWSMQDRPRADALVTDRPEMALGIVTADCAPVLLADSEAGVVGAAHAGWRGAREGVIESAVAAMESLGARPSRIAAAIGPCIAQASYEVDERFRAAFDEADDRFFAEGRAGHWQFDLEGYVASRLLRAGIQNPESMGLDTYVDPARFYSFRRATHSGEPTYGRMIAVIGLPRNR